MSRVESYILYFFLLLVVVGGLWRFDTVLDRLDKQQDRTTKVANVNKVLSTQLCKVVVNVNASSKIRLKSERARLKNSRQFLRQAKREGDTSNLVLRVQQTLPTVKEDVKASKGSVKATNPPKSCIRRLKKKNESDS